MSETKTGGYITNKDSLLARLRRIKGRVGGLEG